MMYNSLIYVHYCFEKILGKNCENQRHLQSPISILMMKYLDATYQKHSDSPLLNYRPQQIQAVLEHLEKNPKADSNVIGDDTLVSPRYWLD